MIFSRLMVVNNSMYVLHCLKLSQQLNYILCSWVAETTFTTIGICYRINAQATDKVLLKYLWGTQNVLPASILSIKCFLKIDRINTVIMTDRQKPARTLSWCIIMIRFWQQYLMVCQCQLIPGLLGMVWNWQVWFSIDKYSTAIKKYCQ
jgi:hypothetical protein